MPDSPDPPFAQPCASAQRLTGAQVADTLHALDEHGYDGWLVLEQDTAITADEPAVNSAAMLAARESIAFLNSAHRTEEIHR